MQRRVIFLAFEEPWRKCNHVLAVLLKHAVQAEKDRRVYALRRRRGRSVSRDHHSPCLVGADVLVEHLKLPHVPCRRGIEPDA